MYDCTPVDPGDLADLSNCFCLFWIEVYCLGVLHLDMCNFGYSNLCCFSFGSVCWFFPCWPVFHPKLGMRPCGIRFLAFLPLLYICSS